MKRTQPMELLSRFAGEEKETVFIYALVASDAPLDVRYVGQTKQPEARLVAHCTRPTEPAFAWAREVTRRGAVVEMRLLERVWPRRAFFAERDWIEHFLETGARLHNAPRSNFIAAWRTA